MISFKGNITFCVRVACLCVLLQLCFAVSSYGQTENSIIAFGDSLTEGCDVHILGYTDCGWLGGYGYKNKLELLLADNGFDITVQNHGKGGETTAEGINRLDTLLNNAACDSIVEYILILEGTNDLFHHRSVDDIIFNLEVIINKVLAKGIQPILATIPPDPDHPYKEIALLNLRIRELALHYESQVILADQYNALAPNWNEYTNPRGCYGDLLHPNPKGFDAMAVTWFESLYPLLPEPYVPPQTFPWMMLLIETP